jgi:hypothetical protein
MTLVWRPGFSGLTQPEALAYVTAVEAADGQALETGVARAVDDFIIGCKADGIWSAIKASCILAGARTLNGALVPLVGAAPTNFNFVSGDYDRKTGLVGDAAAKYLQTGWSPSAANQNNMHLAAYASTINATGVNQHLIGASSPSELWYAGTGGSTFFVYRANDGTGQQNIGTNSAGLYGWSRSDSANKTIRYPSISVVQSQASTGVHTGPVTVYARPGATSVGGHRLAFFTAGESLDLAALDTRVTRLLNLITYALTPDLPELVTMDLDAAVYIGGVYRAGGTLA